MNLINKDELLQALEARLKNSIESKESNLETLGYIDSQEYGYYIGYQSALTQIISTIKYNLDEVK
jgi:tetrahydromethanopterin S-methyltransferase subunit B